LAAGAFAAASTFTASALDISGAGATLSGGGFRAMLFMLRPFLAAGESRQSFQMAQNVTSPAEITTPHSTTKKKSNDLNVECSSLSKFSIISIVRPMIFIDPTIS
jgi:hypothetical protein